ncbi:MAG: helix-turn-helix domain-containing protein [Actinomycetota bacterium]|nr:helix-turn-helix domain-containing protein [Actinomycetota bacterium]
MTDDAAGVVDVARRAVEHAQGEPPKPHGDPLAAVVPTGEAPRQAPQRPVEALGEASEGDHRRESGPRPALTITEAARAADVDRRTIRRRLDAGDLPHAYREDDGEGPWRIPIDDLLAAGLHLHAPAPPPPNDSDGPARGPVPPPPAFSEVAEWRRRAEVAEALAAERERTIRALELALRALGPGPPTTTEASTGSPPAPVPAPPSQPEPAPRPTWWRRRRR